MSRRKISWSEIPPELLSIIAGRLHRRSDILNFRSICQSWRKSAPFSLLAGKITILSPILPHNFSFPLTSHVPWAFREHPLVLVATSVILVRSLVNPSLPPWLVFVEESNPGKLYLREPLSRSIHEVLPKDFPNNLSLTQFGVSEISRLYTLSHAPSEEDLMIRLRNRESNSFKKAVLYNGYDNNGECEVESEVVSPVRIDHCGLMVLYDDVCVGSLAKICLKDGGFSYVSSQSVSRFDDVVCYKGRVCVIDRKGRLYWEENGWLGRPMAVSEPVGEGLGTDRKKRLVVDSSCGELYLVYRCPRYMGVVFKVYKLNEGKKIWEELKGIGDDRILVATHDGCFFVRTKDIPTWGGNCLVFSKGVFPAYSTVHGADSEIFKASKETTLDIAVFDFGSGECNLISNGYAKVLWPPPAWLSSDAHSSKWGSQKDGDLERDSLVQNCTESSGIKEISCLPGFQGDTQANERLSSTDNLKNLFDEGCTPDITRCDNVITRCNNGTLKSFESGVSKTKFEGVDVSSDLVPTLKEIWAKHGNILKGRLVQSNDLVAWALESMAKVVILLQNTSGMSLNKSQADYLRCTLFDLQLMRVDVSWLVSSVAKALNCTNP